MRSSYDSERFVHLVALAFDYFPYRKVDQFQISPRIYHKVFRFYVPAHYEIIMEIFDDHNHAGCIELTVLSGKQPYFLHYIVEILSCNILTDHKKVVFSLKGFPHLNQKGITDGVQNFSLFIDEFLYLVLLQLGFAV